MEERLYHVHLYFKLEGLEKVKALETAAAATGIYHFMKICDKPIGPHPLPTLEMHFFESKDSLAREWVRNNHGEFSTLIHEETGNDVYDHENNIEWFGEPVKIDFDFFDLILKHPELRIHPLKT